MGISFTIVTGKEKYKVVDLVTGGVAWFTRKVDACRYMRNLNFKLGHNYRLEVNRGYVSAKEATHGSKV